MCCTMVRTWPVLMYTENSAPFLMRLALQVWCLTTPPPKITLQTQYAN
jgi:hypothetical protein